MKNKESRLVELEAQSKMSQNVSAFEKNKCSMPHLTGCLI